MKDYEEIENEAIETSRKKKPKMKVSGKSVFLLEKKSREEKKEGK